MKYLPIIAIILLALIGFAINARAATILYPTGGGTGWGNIQANTLLTGNGTSRIATTSIGSGLTLSGGVLSATGGSSVWPFTPSTNYGQNVQATTTGMWFQGAPYSLMASGTSAFSTTTFTTEGDDGVQIISKNSNHALDLNRLNANGIHMSAANSVTGYATTDGSNFGIDASGVTIIRNYEGTGFNLYDGSGTSDADRALTVSSAGYLGTGTSTPFAPFSIGIPAITTLVNNTVFAIGSSTANSTTTLLSLSNIGALTIANGLSATTGAFSSTLTAASIRGGTGATSGVTLTGTSSTAPTTGTLTLGLTSGAIGLSQLRFSTSGLSLGTSTGATIGGFTIGTSSTSSTFKPQLVLTDTSAGTDLKHWWAGSQNGSFYIGRMTDLFATSTALTITSGNLFGLGTTSPSQVLSVQGNGLISGNLAVAGLTATGTITFTGLGSGLVKSTSGVLSNATAGTDYENPLTFSYPLQRTSNTVSLAFGTTTANSWSQLQQFNGNASTTQLSATTAFFGGSGTTTITSTGSVGIGTTSPWAQLSIHAPAGATAFAIGSSTSTSFIVSLLGRVGIGTSSPLFNFSLGRGLGILVPENNLATSTTQTVDWSQGNQQLIRLGTSATTITFTNYTDGAKLNLVVCNPNSSAGAITWPNGGTLMWPGGTVATQTTAANKCDLYYFLATQGTSTLKVFNTGQAASY